MSNAGWFPQPDGQERYYDGEQWTDDFRPAQQGSQPPQPAYGQAPPPPQKKGFPWKWVVIIVAIVLLVCCGGFAACTAGVIGTADEVSKSMDSDASKEGGPDNPMPITEGEAFEVDGFNYAAGWKVTEEFGDANITGLKVTNNRDQKDSVMVEIKFMKGSEVLALVDCTTDPIQKGNTVSVDCFSTDKLPDDYDEITINDSF